MRPWTTWAIVGGVVVLLGVGGVDALRSALHETSTQTTASEPSTHTTTSASESFEEAPAVVIDVTPLPLPKLTGVRPRVRKFVRRASVICGRAQSELEGSLYPTGAEMESRAAWHEAAARADERSVRALRTLVPPEADRALVDRWLAAAEDEVYLLRQTATAASAGEIKRSQVLSDRRVDATHYRDGFSGRLSTRWHLDPEFLWSCPLALYA